MAPQLEKQTIDPLPAEQPQWGVISITKERSASGNRVLVLYSCGKRYHQQVIPVSGGMDDAAVRTQIVSQLDALTSVDVAFDELSDGNDSVVAAVAALSDVRAAKENRVQELPVELPAEVQQEPTKAELFWAAFGKLQSALQFVDAGILPGDNERVAELKKQAEELFDPSLIGGM